MRDDGGDRPTQAADIHASSSPQARRLPAAALDALAADVVSLLARRLARHEREGAPSQAAFDLFVSALLDDDAHPAAGLIERAHAEGTPLDTLYLSYLAPAARRLGTLWDEDAIDFVQVTIAVGRLHAIVRALRRHLPEVAAQDPRRHALFLIMPGDDHRLGGAIAADFFRARGWDIQLEQPASLACAVESLARGDHSVVGISASQARQVGELIRWVSALRACRVSAFILISGPIVEHEAHLLELVDADALAHSAAQALERLEELIVNRRRWVLDQACDRPG